MTRRPIVPVFARRHALGALAALGVVLAAACSQPAPPPPPAPVVKSPEARLQWYQDCWGFYNAKDWDHRLDYREIDGEHDVFGDGSVVLLPTPGHTPGHQSLWIRPAPGVQFVLTADACYTQEHLERMVLPSAVHDAPEMTRSMQRLRDLRERQSAQLLYGHDAAQWRALPHAPKPLA